jgi:hypothetical protein
MNKLLSGTIALVAYTSADCAYKTISGLEDLDPTKLATGKEKTANVDLTTLPGYWLMTHSTYMREDRVGCVDLHLGTAVDNDPTSSTTGFIEGA